MGFSELLSNTFVKLVFAFAFFLFIYKILYAVGVFFGLDTNILNMYFLWLAILIFLITLLPTQRSRIKY